MVSEKEANAARAQHSDFLRKLGAHSIAIREIKGKGGKGFAVVAFFAKKPAKAVPQTLKVRFGKKTLDVPLIVGLMKMPSPETAL
jgi:hypothetical protein